VSDELRERLTLLLEAADEVQQDAITNGSSRDWSVSDGAIRRLFAAIAGVDRTEIAAALARPAPQEAGCICPDDCDCQDYPAGLVSEGCPVHNWSPSRHPECPTHGRPLARPEPQGAPCPTCNRTDRHCPVHEPRGRSDGVLAEMMEEAPSERDWAEDASYENANYQCRCADCGSFFIGHKRRVVCRACTIRRERGGGA
jgi:hypothetical protein